MKSTIIIFFALFISISNFAQQGINYKALIRDGSGNVIANQSVTLQFIIYEGAALTNNVYQESHTVNTDANGIVIVNIGQGTTSNVFANINWGNDQHFLNVQVNTGSGLVDMGTTEFMSVPYAKYATTAANVTGLEKITEGTNIGWRLIGSDKANYGDIGVNATDLSYSDSPSAVLGATGDYSTAMGGDTKASGDFSTSIGFLTQAEALASTAIGFSNIGGGNPTSWVDTDPIFEIGNGSLLAFSNALTVLKNGTITAPSFDIAEITDNKALITKEYADANLIPFEIKNVTRIELDALTPVFGQIVYDSTDGFLLFWNGFKWLEMANFTDCFPQATIANAGPNQTITTASTSTILAANTPVEGTGTWSIFSGTGGAFDDVHNPSATFTGTPCTDYVLVWDITSVCNNKISTVNISFNEVPTTANAGSDVISITQTTVGLSGNTPTVGTGTWTVVSGVGGSFSDANSPNTSFTGNNNTTYTLRWTITSSCGNTSFDELYVFIGNAIGLFNHGGVIFYVDGTGQHGLVCDIIDRSGPWGCPGILIAGADGTAIGTGLQNTIDIEAGCATTGTAADICANLTLNGFTDWFLPSSDELIEMYNNRAIIDNTAIANGGAAFILNNGYISSSERNSSFGWAVRYSDGLKVQVSKSTTDKVRAVRAF